MNYDEYDDIQAGLGAVADSFAIDMKKILANSSADRETKKLVEECCACTLEAFKELSVLVSRTARLLTD